MKRTKEDVERDLAYWNRELWNCGWKQRLEIDRIIEALHAELRSCENVIPVTEEQPAEI